MSVFIFFFFNIIVYCTLIVYSTFYSVCNTDASDVCAIKITYLLVFYFTFPCAAAVGGGAQ